MILEGLSKDPELDDSNRPGSLKFYSSLRSEETTGPDKRRRSLAYRASWFT